MHFFSVTLLVLCEKPLRFIKKKSPFFLGVQFDTSLWNARYEAEFLNGVKIGITDILTKLADLQLEPNVETFEIGTKISANDGNIPEIT